jgi:hypothetical protein
MKWSEEKVIELKKLAFAGVPNPQIAKQLGVGVSDVYAKRSQLGITMDKIKTAKAVTPVSQEPKKASVKEIDEDRAARNREADANRNLLQLLEPILIKADPSIKAIALRDQGQLVRIEYKDDTRRYVGIHGDSLTAVIYDVARVCLK